MSRCWSSDYQPKHKQRRFGSARIADHIKWLHPIMRRSVFILLWFLVFVVFCKNKVEKVIEEEEEEDGGGDEFEESELLFDCFPSFCFSFQYVHFHGKHMIKTFSLNILCVMKLCTMVSSWLAKWFFKSFPGVKCTPNDPIECTGRNPMCVFSKLTNDHRCCADVPQDLSNPPGVPEQVKPSKSFISCQNKLLNQSVHMELLPTIFLPLCYAIQQKRRLVRMITLVNKLLIIKCWLHTICISAARQLLWTRLKTVWLVENDNLTIFCSLLRNQSRYKQDVFKSLNANFLRYLTISINHSKCTKRWNRLCIETLEWLLLELCSRLF